MLFWEGGGLFWPWEGGGGVLFIISDLLLPLQTKIFENILGLKVSKYETGEVKIFYVIFFFNAKCLFFNLNF